MDLLRARFISFNYTNTLEAAYGISATDVLYLHGTVMERDSIVLGHGDNEQSFDIIGVENEYEQDLETGEVNICGTSADEIDIHEINRSAIEHYNDSKKNSKEIIAENTVFFQSLNLISDVFVLGHSLSDVDHTYFEHILDILPSSAIWHVSYYTEKERIEFPRKLSDLGVAKYSLGTLQDILAEYVP